METDTMVDLPFGIVEMNVWVALGAVAVAGVDPPSGSALSG